MIEIGRINTLTALRQTSVGFFLGDLSDRKTQDFNNDILLPNKYVPETLEVDDDIDVFVYTDSEDRPIATTLTPAIQRNEFATLQVVSITSAGAFLDWGLEKDLLVPHREQARPMQVGEWYVVFMYLDRRTNRLVASSKVSRFLDPDVSELQEGDEVQLLAYETTDLGVNVIINNRYKGLIYANEIFRTVQSGDPLIGYIKNIRDDGLVDVSLQKAGFENVEPNAQRILTLLKVENGFLPLTDNSPPEEIYKALEMSKKTFKKAIGTLYRERKIVLEEKGIRLV
ncbi:MULTISPECIES: S1-like domain-containing RNA-binding protein [unclassified Spirosoma]|uniref:CvfB family protein n=1 Tax=unclassified Spirosoma TaxID=2621999 RepID=UPI000966CEE0|nr:MULTISPECIES: S1-like domain-containing RNA-binding protein [unclassified Spirosoma]MBN8821504.1 GntR family transcriptional regulator [Spirosoma sp.]OJW78283.1 MAG: GntR family transcriptional regulator [Spirosoma sp. 48-14]